MTNPDTSFVASLHFPEIAPSLSPDQRLGPLKGQFDEVTTWNPVLVAPDMGRAVLGKDSIPRQRGAVVSGHMEVTDPVGQVPDLVPRLLRVSGAWLSVVAESANPDPDATDIAQLRSTVRGVGPDLNRQVAARGGRLIPRPAFHERTVTVDGDGRTPDKLRSAVRSVAQPDMYSTLTIQGEGVEAVFTLAGTDSRLVLDASSHLHAALTRKKEPNTTTLGRMRQLVGAWHLHEPERTRSVPPPPSARSDPPSRPVTDAATRETLEFLRTNSTRYRATRRRN